MKTIKQFLEVINTSYETNNSVVSYQMSRLAFIGEQIFNLTTYDDEMSEFLAQKCIEVCKVIRNRETFKYIEDAENYKWFLTVVNFKFFSNCLDWGTSIRGCWFDTAKEFKLNCSFELSDITIKSREELENFIDAVLEFASKE